MVNLLCRSLNEGQHSQSNERSHLTNEWLHNARDDTLGRPESKRQSIVERCRLACATPAIRLRFLIFWLESLAVMRISLNGFRLRCDQYIRVSFVRCHFPICTFLRFGKAGWDCAAKGNISKCARYFFFVAVFFKYAVSPAENKSREAFLKTLF